ncbi:DUF1802 family protein [Microcoleus sp. FACHB-831]|uniref:DUF1802 family protein n=1 Tax=Microcoleus sp. FACHB-831 TaxID=2692827 RepID=UPI0016873AE0|nr:DUF1802 family protein [Microcoleus sp. FACHB-831]MBD1921577.1 DUF1802 family protein [Microcoleus sp. FACHB-831]
MPSVNSVNIDTAIRLPAPDIEALIQGRAIAAMPRLDIGGRQFALYPGDASINLLLTEQHYRPNFLSIAQTAFTQLNPETTTIKAWAKCELCQILDGREDLDALSQLTIWKKEALEKILSQFPYIFLAHLRVYLLSQPLEIPAKNQGRFVALPHPLSVTDDSPVLSDRTFNQRRHQLENRLPPQHPELEELQGAIAQLTITNPAAKELDRDIKIFLGWGSDEPAKQLDRDWSWIEKIAEIGNSSDGHTFEKLVRRGLLKLGFSGSGIDPESMGGAGGMDFYCESPYPMVGECKATKTEKVPDGTPAQLLKIGMNHLGKAQYDRSIKLIVAAGELNFYANRTATENQMNVIRPETLQRLVEVQAQQKNSINLLELKQCLQQEPFGLADDKVNTYIDNVWKNIRLRSHLVQLVKNYVKNTGLDNAGVEALHGAYFGSNPPQPLKTEEMHEILIELSSPLTGYLGRIKGSDWRSDRFYFLRDLSQDT